MLAERPTPRIAWDNALAGQNQTGTGVYAANLLAQLRRDPRLRVAVYNGWRLGPAQGSPLARAWRNGRDLAWTHAGLPLQLLRQPADLLHAPAFVAPPRAPCPLVVAALDTIYLRYPSHYRRWWVQYLRGLLPVVLRKAAAVITISEHAKQAIMRAYGLAPDKVHVTLLGVDHGRYHPVATGGEATLSRLGLRDGYVLHVGALVRRKNIPGLLRAVAWLRQRGRWPDRPVVLVGAASPGLPGAAEVMDSIESLGLGDTVVLAGHVPDAALPTLYAHAGLLAMPSLDEGFGLPLVEAMACGVPVVASAASCLPEIVGEAGCLVAPYDTPAWAGALEAVLGDLNLRVELRERGLLRARNFSWERTAAETAAVYRRVLRFEV